MFTSRGSTNHLTCLQTIPGIPRELLPRKLVQLAAVLLRLLGHEEETPALQVPRFDFLVVRRHDPLQDKERCRVERKLQEELHKGEPARYWR